MPLTKPGTVPLTHPPTHLWAWAWAQHSVRGLESPLPSINVEVVDVAARCGGFQKSVTVQTEGQNEE